MPRIGGGSLAAHSDVVWTAVLDGIDRLLSKKPLDDISVADIAAEAGLARNTLYNYAADKRALVTHAAELAAADFYRHLQDLVPENTLPRDQIIAVANGVLEWFSHGRHRHLVGLMLFGQSGFSRPNTSGDDLTPFLKKVAEIVSKGIEIGQFKPTPDICWTVYLMAAAMDPAVRQVLASPSSASELSPTVTTFFLRALGSE